MQQVILDIFLLIALNAALIGHRVNAQEAWVRAFFATPSSSIPEVDDGYGVVFRD